MGRRITLEIPDETYDTIQARAAARGQTLEEFALERLGGAVESLRPTHAQPFDPHTTQDPLEALVGTLTCAESDVADRHDDYIGRAIAAGGDGTH